MASKRQKQANRSLVDEDRPQKRSNNQVTKSSRPVKTAEKRSSAVKSAESRGSEAKSAGKRRSQPRLSAEKTAESAPPASMNREMKRMMKRREAAADRLRRPTVAPKGKRTRPLSFVKEVRGELARVAWPTRQEVITYTLVVIVTVAFFLIVIGAIDYVFLKGILFLIGQKGS
jgi:preprotein translocase subunit SecE